MIYVDYLSGSDPVGGNRSPTDTNTGNLGTCAPFERYHGLCHTAALTLFAISIDVYCCFW